MRSLTQIKQHAEVCVVFTEQHPEGIPGFVTLIDGKACWCHPVAGGYTWVIAGEHAREGTVRSLLSGD